MSLNVKKSQKSNFYKKKATYWSLGGLDIYQIRALSYQFVFGICIPSTLPQLKMVCYIIHKEYSSVLSIKSLKEAENAILSLGTSSNSL
jgi:hypothetical protein